MAKQHLVFYDGSCGLCDHLVQFLLKNDTKGMFLFAPLQGSTAKALFKKNPEVYENLDTLVLVEDYQTDKQKMLFFGKAALRIAWLLGGVWTLVGWISFLPSPLYDWAYRLVARNRKRFFSGEVCALPQRDSKERFLP